MRTTKEDMEGAGGEGEQECWFEGECHESSKMESGSWRDCWQSGVNLATPVYGINPDQNWIDDDDWSHWCGTYLGAALI